MFPFGSLLQVDVDDGALLGFYILSMPTYRFYCIHGNVRWVVFPPQLKATSNFSYSRSHAAFCLGFMAVDDQCKSEIVDKGGTEALVKMIFDSKCRYEQSYSGLALFYLGVKEV